MALVMVVGCVGLMPFQVNAEDYGTSVTVSNGSNSDIYAAVTRHSGSYYDWQEYGLQSRALYEQKFTYNRMREEYSKMINEIVK